MKCRKSQVILSILLSLALLFGGLSIPAGAEEDQEVLLPGGIMTQEVAEIIAGFFVADYVEIGQDITWTSETEIANVVTLYDTDGEISAYSCELKTNGRDHGYIVVSAYPDIENVILEFSDQALPIYDGFSVSNGNKIVYTGVLEYYLDDGGPELLNSMNEEINRLDIINTYELARTGVAPLATITNPFEYAKEKYGGNWESYEWNNPCESAVSFGQAVDFIGYQNSCVPLAIANLIKTYGNYRNISSIKNLSLSTVFSRVINYGITNKYYKNAPMKEGGGAVKHTKYLEESFNLFNLAPTVSELIPTYANVKDAINKGRLFMLTVYDHVPYGDHSVVGFAYTRLRNKNNGDYKSFIKVADGFHVRTEPRYIDFSDAIANNGFMSTVSLISW